MDKHVPQKTIECDMPTNCKIILHTTTFNGILHILNDGSTLDTLSILKNMYNNRKVNDDGSVSIMRVDGFSEEGPSKMKTEYVTLNECFNDYNYIVERAPKGHYASIYKGEWKKPFRNFSEKKVKLAYKWRVMGYYHVRRSCWDESTPSEDDVIKDEPGPNGELCFKNGINSKDWLFIAIPGVYKNEERYKDWVKEVEDLASKRGVDIVWTGIDKRSIYKLYTGEDYPTH